MDDEVKDLCKINYEERYPTACAIDLAWSGQLHLKCKDHSLKHAIACQLWRDYGLKPWQGGCVSFLNFFNLATIFTFFCGLNFVADFCIDCHSYSWCVRCDVGMHFSNQASNMQKMLSTLKQYASVKWISE